MSVEGRAKLKGEWFITLIGEDGQVKDKRQGFNVVTDVGKEFLASFLSSATAGAATFTGRYIALGSDSTAEAASNTALGTELSRQSGIASYLSNQIFQVTATFAAGSGTGAIVEYGLFSTLSAGTLIARDTEAVINKAAGDTMIVVAQLTIS
jgi:hypothetical protein